MKKKLIIGIFAIAVMGLSAFGVQKSFNSPRNVSQLTLDNLEAFAGGDENGGDNGDEGGFWDWWDRLDYVCEQIVCKDAWGTEWYADRAVRVEDGQGDNAHAWGCTTCGLNNGF